MPVTHHDVLIILLDTRRREQWRVAVVSMSVWVGMAVIGQALVSVFSGWLPMGCLVASVLYGVYMVAHWRLLPWQYTAWRNAADLGHHAKNLEMRVPALHGRLILLTEHHQGRHAQLSDAWIERHQSVVGQCLVDADVAYGVRGWTLWQRVTVVMALLGVMWLGQSGYTPWSDGLWKAANVAPLVTANVAVGDLVLAYHYPAYTGLDTRIVTNSTGAINGVPGTRVVVTAKTRLPFASAAINVGEQPPLRADVLSDNRLSGAITIGARDAEYWLTMTAESGVVSSPRYPIVVDIDTPPVVTLSASDDVVTIGVHEPLGVEWRVEDDFGVSRVRWRVDGVDGRQDLLGPTREGATVSGQLTVRPIDLGLKSGDRARLQVIAWDNNAVSGAQRGESSEMLFVVGGGSGVKTQRHERQAELLAVLLPLLSGHLQVEWPPSGTVRGIAAWGKRLNGRMSVLDGLYEQYQIWGIVGLERRLLDDVAHRQISLVRRTQSLDRSEDTITESFLAALESDLSDLVQSEEDAVYLLDRSLRAAAIENTYQSAQRFIRLSSRVERALDAEATMSQLSTIFSSVVRVVEDARIAHQNLERGALQTMAVRGSDRAVRLVDKIRDGQSDDEQIKGFVGRLVVSLRDTGVGVSDMIDAMKAADNELQSEAEGLVEALQVLESGQRDLWDVVYELRESEDADLMPALETLWDDIGRLSGKAHRLGGQYEDGLVRHRRSFGSRTRASEAVGVLERLLGAVRGRDMDGVERSIAHAQRVWRGVESIARFEHESGSHLAGPTRADVTQIQDILVLLDERMVDLAQQATTSSPVLQVAVRQLSARQGQLAGDLSEAQKAAHKLAVELPVPPRGMIEHLEGAALEMSRADGALMRGQSMAAQGSMGAAAQRISDALDALLDALAASASTGSGNEAAGGGGLESTNKPAPFDMEIPGPEEFRSAEAYRAALLKGLAAEVPESYGAAKNRYFEELVVQ